MSDEPPKQYKKYVPKPDGLNLELHKRSVASGYYCQACFSDKYHFVPVSGVGSIYSFAINHFTIDRAWIEELPYITAVVELAEGPRVVGALRNVEPGGVTLGDAVTVSVESRGEDFAFIWVDLNP